MKDVIEDGGVPGWKHAGWPIAFTELFAAHEFLDKGLLQDVLREVQRVELARGSRGDSFKHQSTQIIFNFYLALGKFQKAHTLAEEVDIPELTQAWLAFLAGKPADYQEYIEDFRDELMEAIPDPIEQQRFLLSLNIGMVKYPIDLLAPLYEPDTAVAMVSAAGETSPEFMSWPILEAKLQLVRGKQMLDKGQAGEAIVSLKSGVRWFRDRGGWGMFPYYFLGTELLAIAYAEQGDLQAAYRLLEDAAGRRIMVNTLSTPLHQRILARLALIARELGRTARAESIESELAEALRLADEDHPILVQIREQHEVKLEID
jgi:tetratricopeptide (TPR) repeat protein